MVLGFLLLPLDPSPWVISSVPMDLNILKLMTSKFVFVAMTSPVNSDPRIRRPLDISLWGLPDTSDRSWPCWTSGFSPQFSHSHPHLNLPISANPTCSVRSLHATRRLPALVMVLLSEITPRPRASPLCRPSVSCHSPHLGPEGDQATQHNEILQKKGEGSV